MTEDTANTRLCSRQTQIEALDVGDTLTITHRIDLTYGINEKEKNEHSATLRALLEQPAQRSKRKHRGRNYVVENYVGHGARGAIMYINASVTRTA